MSVSNEDLLKMAGVAHVAGRLAEAEEQVGRVLASDPLNLQANLLMGVVAGKTNRPELAFNHLETVLSVSPNSFEAFFWMSILHRRAKNLEAATQFAERANKVRQADAHALNNLGLCYLDQVRLDDAVKVFEQAVKIRPDMAQILHNLGTALYLLGRDFDAAKAFDQALLIAPKSTDSYLSLGQVMLSMTTPSEAAKCARRALQINPNLAEGHLLLASALVEDSLTGEAEKHLKTAIELNPQDSQAHGLLGQRFQSLGKFAEANAFLRRSIELEPRQGFAYFAYVHNNKMTEADLPMIERMEDLLAKQGLDPRQTMFLYYGLGRAYEMLAEYEKAMQNFDHANRVARKLKFGNAVFDRKKYVKGFDWLIETFNKDMIDQNRPSGHPSDLPIVIVGMMRSGTTLAEQILSSHPMIGAAGEQRYWPTNRRILFGENGESFRAARLPQAGAKYVDVLRKISPNTPHVTDKMPANYELLGAIHLAVPNARIIHMRRNPVDTCISIFATPNRVPVEFAYDRDNIVFAYEQYLRVMEHWRSVLPPDRFIEVNYEDVVIDREKQARRMLELVGLDWDEALLHHEQNERNVITPSLWQVRQPIYTSSVERWRRYEPWLGSFRKLLPV